MTQVTADWNLQFGVVALPMDCISLNELESAIPAAQRQVVTAVCTSLAVESLHAALSACIKEQGLDRGKPAFRAADSRSHVSAAR